VCHSTHAPLHCHHQAYDALPEGGAFIALDVVIDDGRRDNLWGLLMSLDMLLEFEGEVAADYTLQVRRPGSAAACWSRTRGHTSPPAVDMRLCPRRSSRPGPPELASGALSCCG
jgi:hypothetical protein